MVANDEMEMSVDSTKEKNGHLSEKQMIIPKKKKNPPKEQTVGPLAVFRFADGWDMMLMITGTLMAIINGTLLPISLILLGWVADSFVTHVKMSNIHEVNASNKRYCKATCHFDSCRYAIYYAIVGFTALLAASMQVCLWTLAAGRQARRLRILFFHRVMRQEISWFDITETGELNTRLANDVFKIQEGIGDKVSIIIQAYTTFFSALIIGFCNGWKITLVILAVSPALGLITIINNQMLARITAQEQTAYAKAGAVAEEALSAVRTVFAFSGQKKEIKKYHKNLEKAKDMGIKKAFIANFAAGVNYLITYLTLALSFWYGCTLVMNNEYTIGNLLTVFLSMTLGSSTVEKTSANVQSFTAGRGAAYKIYSIIDQTPSITSFSNQGFQPDYISGDIEFKNIHFSYPSRPKIKILDNMCMSVKNGQTIALVGSSGSGKSTTIQLLQRFYDPQEGSIFIDGHDIRSLNIRYLREMIGVVSQEPVLFATTIADNIRYGRPDVTMEEIVQATKESNAFDFIMELPHKFDTLVGHRGTQLSGGQKQRIAIARALVRNPKILLLDEATSALDAESETIVQAALDKVRQGRTTVVVAHRLSTIRNADIIAGFSNGQIVEVGTHSQLVEKRGVYHNLVNMQTFHRVEDSLETDSDFPFGGRSPLAESLSRTSLCRRKSTRGSSFTASDGIRDDTANFKQDQGKREEDENVPPVSFLKVMRLNISEWPYILVGTICAMINGLASPAYSFLFAGIVGVFTHTDQNLIRQRYIFLSLMFVVMGCIYFVATFLQGFTFGKSGEVLTLKLRLKAFTSMMKQDLGWFDKPKNNVGALITGLAVDAAQVQGAAGVRMATLLQSFSNIGASVIIAFVFSWELTLVCLTVVPFLTISAIAEMRTLTEHAAEEKKELEAAGKIAAEAIDNIRTVVSLGREATFESLYEKNLIISNNNAIQKTLVHGCTYSFHNGLLYFSYGGAFRLGAWLVERGRIDVMGILLVVGMVLHSAVTIGEANASAPNFAKAKMAAASLMRLITTEPSIDNLSEEGETLETYDGNVQFEDIRFNYPSRPDMPVLQGLNLRVKKGETLALVGSSGCGKSTIIQLLERFYDPREGRVLLDSVDVKELNIHWLRSQIGIVSQEPVLFDCSLAENIAYGDNSRTVTMEEIEAAAKAANIHSFIELLPQKYNTQAGDKGTQLSGGQKQRIAIARAIVRNPKVLLLDEATSALDTESEKVVQEALDQARQGRTCIIVAHRLSTIQNADRIAVLQEGAVVEQGTHQQLMLMKGVYHMLVTKQMGHHKD
ncbi:ATP-dependent translocase ABCB1-like [Nelusetta ayraudi]|uniref:ATP-dependent translocase ABCB1-like n=1 Tax=Nelusetta ayraudi TaxID=303726 RepID=UPI003F72E9A3